MNSSNRISSNGTVEVSSSIEVSSILHNNNNNSNNKEKVKKDLHERFISDHKQLKEWADISPLNDHWTGIDVLSSWCKYHDKLGGAESISLKIQNILLDIDNDGNITEEELKQSEEKRKDTVDQALSLLTTAGVVGALLASIMTPLILSPISYSSESEEYFINKPKTLEGLAFTYRIFLSLSLTFSFLLIWQSSRKYLQLSFWMPNLDMKTWYLSEVSLLPIIIIQMWCIIFALLALPFGVTVFVSPANGLIVLIIELISVISEIFDTIFGKGDLFIVKAMHNYTRNVIFKIERK